MINSVWNATTFNSEEQRFKIFNSLESLCFYLQSIKEKPDSKYFSHYVVFNSANLGLYKTWFQEAHEIASLLGVQYRGFYSLREALHVTLSELGPQAFIHPWVRMDPDFSKTFRYVSQAQRNNSNQSYRMQRPNIPPITFFIDPKKYKIFFIIFCDF